MKVLVSGSTGLIGSALVLQLVRKGHTVVRLVRHQGKFDEAQIGWDPEKGVLNASELEGIEAVIHLAGENIAAGRWDDERKAKILHSRVKGTKLLIDAIKQVKTPPSVFIGASATGFYGDQGDTVLTEVGSTGNDFLARVCREWEQASDPLTALNIRVAHTRFGVVLSNKGGALKAMEWPFRLGLAGNLGNGKQYFSWIVLEDVVNALLHVLETPSLRGPVNFTAPNPVTNAEFTTAMRHQVIPTFLPMHYWTPPVPALAVEALLGEMGKALLLASARVLPVCLQETNFTFKYPTLKPALEALL